MFMNMKFLEKEFSFMYKQTNIKRGKKMKGKIIFFIFSEIFGIREEVIFEEDEIKENVKVEKETDEERGDMGLDVLPF